MATKATEKMVKVRVPRDKSRKEDSIFVSVNEKTYQVKVGEWVEVPESVAEVIQTSIDAMDEAYEKEAAIATA